ncbi:MAG: RsmD family RNA methyltransferase, partial [Acidimicrobiales bacterium]
DRGALATLEQNLATLGFEDRATIVAGPVAGALSGLPPADIAFCDPPYADDPWLDLLAALRAALLVGHAQEPIPLTDHWRELRRRSYGKAQIVIAERVVDPEVGDGDTGQQF